MTEWKPVSQSGNGAESATAMDTEHQHLLPLALAMGPKSGGGDRLTQAQHFVDASSAEQLQRSAQDVRARLEKINMRRDEIKQKQSFASSLEEEMLWKEVLLVYECALRDQCMYMMQAFSANFLLQTSRSELGDAQRQIQALQLAHDAKDNVVSAMKHERAQVETELADLRYKAIFHAAQQATAYNSGSALSATPSASMPKHHPLLPSPSLPSVDSRQKQKPLASRPTAAAAKKPRKPQSAPKKHQQRKDLDGDDDDDSEMKSAKEMRSSFTGSTPMALATYGATAAQQAFSASSYQSMVSPPTGNGMYGSGSFGANVPSTIGSMAGNFGASTNASPSQLTRFPSPSAGGLQKRFVSVFLPALACVAVAGSRFYVYLSQVLSSTMEVTGVIVGAAPELYNLRDRGALLCEQEEDYALMLAHWGQRFDELASPVRRFQSVGELLQQAERLMLLPATAMMPTVTADNIFVVQTASTLLDLINAQAFFQRGDASAERGAMLSSKSGVAHLFGAAHIKQIDAIMPKSAVVHHGDKDTAR